MWGFKFAPEIILEISPLEIVSLGITVLLALYVTSKLTKKTEEDRIEKDLLISDLKEFKAEFVSKVHKILHSKTIKVVEVSSTLKVLRIALNTIIELVDKHNLAQTCAARAELDKRIRDINDLLTDVPQDAHDGTVISGGEISLTAERKDKVVAVLYDFNKLVFEVVAAVNRS